MRNKILIICIIIILGAISHFFYGEIFNINGFKNTTYKNCSTPLEKKISGSSMEPFIKPGENVMLFVGYYDCHELERGDLIAYDFANTGNLYIKKLFALGGDKIEINDSQLFINGELMINSTGNIYKFNDAEIKLMNLYIVNGKLKQGSYFVFGDNIGNSTDSRKFGAIGEKDIIGKFEYK